MNIQGEWKDLDEDHDVVGTSRCVVKGLLNRVFCLCPGILDCQSQERWSSLSLGLDSVRY